MPHIRFDKVSFGYTETLFQNVTLTISDYDRIGIVGNNGTGKSTFLKSIAGIIEPTQGRVQCPKGVVFGFIEQDIPEKFRNMNLYDVISAALPADEKIHSAWKVETTLDTFKAPKLIRAKSVKELSGGWQRLALIARIALSQPDILLLDEPTNHLDVAKILVLEKWLNEQVYDIPLVSVSHDRNFLANCTNKTFFLRGTDVREFNCSYEKAKRLLEEEDQASLIRRAKEIKEVNRLKKSAHELRQVGVNNYSDSALKKSLQIARRAEGLEAQLTHSHVEVKRNIKLSNSGTHAKRLIGLKNLSIYSPDSTVLFHIDTLNIMEGERIVIFGPNGCGKSQFLKYLFKAIMDSDSARLDGTTITPSVKPAYIDQHLSHLPLKKSLHDYLDYEFSLGEQKTTGILIHAGFPILQHKTILEKLSHGQRARVAFLMLHIMQPNLFIMDEPTNHLDIDGQEQLEAEVIEQGATSIIVSHDRVFTQNIGTKFYVVANKRLTEIDSAAIFYNDMLNH